MGNCRKEYDTRTLNTGISNIRWKVASGRYSVVMDKKINGKLHHKSKTCDTIEQAVALKEEWKQEFANLKKKYDNVSNKSNISLCSDYCKDCKYSKVLEYRANKKHILYCDYYIMEGKDKNCRGGDECTVKIPIKAKDKEKARIKKRSKFSIRV